MNNTKIIPAKIYYIWIGSEKPKNVVEYIDTWKEKLSDYEIIEINENSNLFNFSFEHEHCKWFREIWDRKMWAYVADYIRCKILYKHGGIYLDTDMTILKDITPLLNNTFFIGYEKGDIISAGIIGTVKNHPLMKEMLNFYQNEIFSSHLYTITSILSYLYKENEYPDVKIYPNEYFYPYYYSEQYSPNCIKENTYAVHWWNGSWTDPKTLYFLDNKHKMTIEEIDKSFSKNKLEIIRNYTIKKNLNKIKFKQNL